jgi:hypothetical protein
MSAQDQKFQVQLTPTAATISATGECGNSYNPLHIPVIVRQWAVLPMVSGLNYATGGMSISLMIQSLVSGSTASAITTITGSTGDAAGVVIVKRNLNTTVEPHQRVFMNNNAVISGAPTIIGSILLEPKWEQPANFDSVRVIS